jgi:hypothetical protein
MIGGIAAAVLIALTAGPGEAAFLTLSDGEVTRAVALGQRSVTTDAPVDTEWRVVNETGESVLVMTPFHRVMVAARHAAFKNEPFSPADAERVLKGSRDRLPFWVQLRGAREDFARFYVPRLVVDDREIEPVFVQNERTAVRQDGRFVARCVYGFATKELTPTSRLVLVVRDSDRRDVSRFAIDLSTMR